MTEGENVTSLEPDPSMMTRDVRSALLELRRLKRSGAHEPAVNLAQDMLLRTKGRLDSILEKSQASPYVEKREDVRRATLEMERIIRLLPARCEIDVEHAYDPNRHYLVLMFGGLVSLDDIEWLVTRCDEFTALVWSDSNSEVDELPDRNHVRQLVRDLTCWWIQSALPIGELLQKATNRTPDLLMTVTAEPQIHEVMAEAENTRQQRVIAQLEDTLQAAQIATTHLGENQLTKAFVVVQDQATSGTRLWTMSVFIFTVLGIIAPFFAINTDIEAIKQLGGTSGLLIKVSAGLPFLVLAAYSGHIAAQHRETSRHLTILIAQIKSVRAYTTQLPDENRYSIMTTFGNRVFADPGFSMQDKGNVTLIPDGASDLVKQITALVEKAKKD